MKTSIKSALFLIFLLIAQVTLSQKKFPENEYEDGTLGNRLQPFFISHCASCGFFKNEKKINKFEDSKDFIVSDIRNIWRGNELLTQQILTSKSDLITIFSHVHKNDEKKIFDSYSGNDIFSDLLTQSYSPAKIGSYTMYSKNCAGYYTSSLDGKIKFPKGSAESSMIADRNYSSIIILNQGKFVSPIHGLLLDNDLGLLFSIWKFYEKNNEYLNMDSYFLKEFEGVIVSNQIKSDKNQKFSTEINASGGFNSQLVSGYIQSNNNLTKAVEEILDSKQYGVIFFKDQLPTSYEELPKLDVVAAKIKSLVKPEFKPVDNFYSVVKGRFVHKIVVSGLPYSMSENYWNVVPLALDYSENLVDSIKFYQGVPTISEIKPLNNNLIEFTIEGRINDNIASSLSGVNLVYKLRSKEQVGGKYLELKPVIENIPTTNHPIVRIAENIVHGTKNINNNRSIQTWDINMEVLDDPGTVTRDKGVRISNVKISKGTDVLALDYDDKLLFNGKDNDIQLKISTKNPLPIDVKTFSDTYNLEITALIEVDKKTIQRKGIGQIEVYRINGSNKPKASVSFQGLATEGAAAKLNYVLNLEPGDIQFDNSFNPTFLEVSVYDRSSKTKIAGSSNYPVDAIAGSPKKYKFSLQPKQQIDSGTIKVLREVSMSGIIAYKYIDGQFENIQHDQVMDIEIPFKPNILLGKIVSSNQNGKQIFSTEISLTDELGVLNNQSKIQCERAIAVSNNKQYTLKSSLQKIAPLKYKLDLEIDGKGIKFDANNSTEYALNLDWSIEINPGQRTKLRIDSKVNGLVVAGSSQ